MFYFLKLFCVLFIFKSTVCSLFHGSIIFYCKQCLTYFPLIRMTHWQVLKINIQKKSSTLTTHRVEPSDFTLLPVPFALCKLRASQARCRRSIRLNQNFQTKKRNKLNKKVYIFDSFKL